jgi:predicted phosphohydrolase
MNIFKTLYGNVHKNLRDEKGMSLVLQISRIILATHF